jgi:RNA polymerase-binding transcription factor DksA
MNSDFEKYRQRLLSLRNRAIGTVGHVAEAIREDVNPSGTLSGAPVHLADAAEATVDSDAEILQMEGSLLEAIESALTRIKEGAYGRCEDCGRKISRERLDAIPFAPCCVDCADRRDQAEDKAELPSRKMSSRRAGQLVDELAPRQSNARENEDRFAAGTPGGGLAAGGLGGSNAGHGDPEPDLQNAFGSGAVDDTREDENEPQAGPHGGAVGGTPAGKRVKPR